MKPDENDHRMLVLWATDCAERVLSRFTDDRPTDDRPRQALEAGRAWARGEIPMRKARSAAFAAHAAARSTDDPGARAAARAAGHAAATAHVPGHARHAAAYAVTAATSQSATEGVTEREWQFQRLEHGLRPVVFLDQVERGNEP